MKPMAITKLEEALLWLRKRTMGRENRGVEGDKCRIIQCGRSLVVR